MAHIIDIFLHLDQHLAQWIQWLGPLIYVLLFAIIFAETGLIVTPFLPGDSLLFAAGALTAIEGGLDLSTLLISLTIAGILGDGVNYHVGKYLGLKVFSQNYRLLKKEHLEQTQSFYHRFGSFTIVAARFAPIVRTFAPFIAGVAEMPYRRFVTFNIVGAIAWVFIFVLAGHYFGQAPVVKRNFQFIIIGIIIVSLLPILFQLLSARRKAKLQK
jgi:membrane-associated protein